MHVVPPVHTVVAFAIEHAVLQQTPPTQYPDVHWLAAVQVAPLPSRHTPLLLQVPV